MCSGRRLLVLLGLLLSFAAAISPLESDCILFDGDALARDGRLRLQATIPAGRRIAGWYANIEGVESLAVWANGQFVAAFGHKELPRSRIGGLDLSDYSGLLRSGQNEIELRTGKAQKFWLRMWTSDNAWYKANFHAHTTYSDGTNSVHNLLQLALGAGAHAYAITDHDQTAQCYDTAFHPVGTLQPIRGTEWSSDLGHANVLGFEGSQVFSLGTVRQLLDDASWRGGLVQINHPCDDELGFGWDNYPVLDSSVDMIEVFNGPTWFPPGKDRGRDRDVEAVSWWHSLLVQGKTIAAVGNADYHGNMPGEGVMTSHTRVFAPSNHPDSILKYAKLGRAMVIDELDDGQIWLYADTNNNNQWDLVMGQHIRVTGTKTIKFRAEIEDADYLDDFWVYNKTGTVHNHWFWNPFGSYDYAYEWTVTYNATSTDFVRAYLENSVNDPELLTNAIYVNYPDYELGPISLLSQRRNWPDSVNLLQPETLRLRLSCTAGFSPWRYGLTVACDTTRFSIVDWQTTGTGIGQVTTRTNGQYRILEWQGGYTWGNRLAVGTTFDYWLVVRPKASGHQPILFRSWANDRIQDIKYEPATGFAGPEGRYWHRESVFVRLRDVQPLAIEVPGAAIDSSGPITPRVRVRNNGNTAASFTSQLTIGTGYIGTATVSGLGPGLAATIDCSPTWQPQRGTHALQLITTLAGDMVPANDTLSGSVFVAVRDIGVASIDIPNGTLVESTLVTPRVDIANYGNTAIVGSLGLAILDTGGTIVASRELTGLTVPLGGLADVELPPEWLATPVGDYSVVAWTVSADDLLPANDTANTNCRVTAAGRLDVGVTSIIAPVGTIDTGVRVIPQAIVSNEGDLPASFNAVFCILRHGSEVYTSLQSVANLGPGASTTLTFAEWPHPHDTGSYVGRCSLVLAGDQNPANDTISRQFTVVAGPNWPGGWHEVAAIPPGSQARLIQDGGWLAYTSPNQRIYASRGNKTRDFYAFDPIANTWLAKASIPAGPINRAVGKGASGIADGDRYIYTVKGNKTLEFYRYDIVQDSWHELEPVPAGTHPVKGGTDLAYVVHHDTGYVYLLKGYRNEFYRFNTTTLRWETERPAPADASPKYDKGSFLVSDGSGVLYAHQAKYHKLYRYDVPTRSWSADVLHGMPFVSRYFNRTRKSNDGGCAAWSNGCIYALKGGNTQEYYRYLPQHDSWQELDTLPQWGYTQRKKKVKSGADITSYAAGILFALKGNKTLECWRWVDWPMAYSLRPSRSGANTVATSDSQSSIRGPNPLRSGLIRLATERLGNSTTLSIYDALGRCVLSRSLPASALSAGHWDLALGSLPSGVYLLQLESGSNTITRKLVIEH